MYQKRNELHYQSHLQKLYYKADQTLKQEQKQALADYTKELLMHDERFSGEEGDQELNKLLQLFAQTDPNSQEYNYIKALIVEA